MSGVVDSASPVTVPNLLVYEIEVGFLRDTGNGEFAGKGEYYIYFMQ